MKGLNLQYLESKLWGESKKLCAQLCGSAKWFLLWLQIDNAAHHDTDTKPQICKKMVNRSVYTESYLYNDEKYADTLFKLQ
jgi:hypothetical protein